MKSIVVDPLSSPPESRWPPAVIAFICAVIPKSGRASPAMVQLERHAAMTGVTVSFAGLLVKEPGTIARIVLFRLA